jgi:hypothetical protein
MKKKKYKWNWITITQVLYSTSYEDDPDNVIQQSVNKNLKPVKLKFAKKTFTSL